jgi:hypothetical protein
VDSKDVRAMDSRILSETLYYSVVTWDRARRWTEVMARALEQSLFNDIRLTFTRASD